MNSEVWKAIPGYDGYYEVSSHGAVRSTTRFVRHPEGGVRKVTGKVLKPHIKFSYNTATLQKEGRTRTCRVARLVLQTFVGGLHGKLQVNHMNGNKSDDRIENLEICTPKENIHHARRTGLLRPPGKKAIVRSDGLIFESIHSAARSVSGSPGNVHSVCNGGRANTKGFKFSYLKEAKGGH